MTDRGPYWDPLRRTTNKPQYEVTFAPPGLPEVRGALTVKSLKSDGSGNVVFEVFWHPENCYRTMPNNQIKAVVNLKTRRKIRDLAAYYS